ncbi:MAG TPA: hypothetical protein VL443_00315 [Cyclobacteriaceae bacterium]|nr:hypothetical protein [Cyclobacteriaceae bacterium]
MKKHSLLALFAVGLCAFYSCSNNDDDSQPAGETNVSTTGGSIKSDDNNITITIPAGAVGKNVLIEVEEVSDVVTNGIGKVYRLTHQEFLKPVTLTLKYDEEEIATKGTYPALLRLMTRSSETDAWEVVDNFTIDTDAKVLKADVDHFSDWTLVSTEGTLSFTVDGVTYSNLDLSVTMGTTLGHSALFYAFNNERFFRATADSTIMGTNYATQSLHLGKISALTNSIADTTNVLFVEPTIKSGCYARFDGSSHLSFTKFSTTSGNLVTGSFYVPGVLPTDNTTCQTKKSISGSFAYKVK